MNRPLYEDKAHYDTWLKVLLGGIAAVVLFTVATQILANSRDALPGFGVLLFIIIVFWLILPRRFQITSDRLRIVLGGPLAFSIPLSDISEVRPRNGIKAFILIGIRFATSYSHTVEIQRLNGLNLVISPAHDDEFAEKLRQAIGTGA